jgi:hypothetical protein
MRMRIFHSLTWGAGTHCASRPHSRPAMLAPGSHRSTGVSGVVQPGMLRYAPSLAHQTTPDRHHRRRHAPAPEPDHLVRAPRLSSPCRGRPGGHPSRIWRRLSGVRLRSEVAVQQVRRPAPKGHNQSLAELCAEGDLTAAVGVRGGWGGCAPYGASDGPVGTVAHWA